MRMVEIDYDGRSPIDSYGPGFFRIAGAVHHGPILLLPTGLTLWDGEDWTQVIAEKETFDVVFVGMGTDIAVLEEAGRNALTAGGVAFEVTATPPACRTYNVLLSEGRRVAAALRPA